MKIKLIIFDLDGTLVDTATDITNALNYATDPYQIKKLTVRETVGLVGEGLTRLIEKLLGEESTDVKSNVLDRFINYYSEHLTDYTVPYPGVRETLEELGNYKKAVISNKREMLSKRVLEEVGLSGYFDVVLGSDSVDEKKPSPKPIYKVMEILSFRSDETLIVGDSNYDIESGKAAGTTTIAVSYGYRDASVLKDADFIIDDIRDLKKILTE